MFLIYLCCGALYGYVVVRIQVSNGIIENCTETTNHQPQTITLLASAYLLNEIAIYGVNIALVLLMRFKVKSALHSATSAVKAEAERQVVVVFVAIFIQTIEHTRCISASHNTGCSADGHFAFHLLYGTDFYVRHATAICVWYVIWRKS
jgi:hypothetical protein